MGLFMSQKTVSMTFFTDNSYTRKSIVMGPFVTQKTVSMTFFTDYRCSFFKEINSDRSFHVSEDCQHNLL